MACGPAGEAGRRMLSHSPGAALRGPLPVLLMKGWGVCVYEEGGTTPLEIPNRGSTPCNVLRNGAGRSVSFGHLEAFFFLVLPLRPGTENENCPGVLLLQELLARDSGCWLGALWPSFYLEAQLFSPPRPPPEGKDSWASSSLSFSLRHLG